MNKWTYYNPVKIQYSDNYIQSIAEYLRTFDKPLHTVLFCYKWFEKTEQFGRLINVINKPFVYSDIEENPSLTSCQQAINAVKNIGAELIIAIGGGSVIDTAKVVRASLYKNEFDVNKVFDKAPVREKIPALFAIPTTHGTGSEVTMWATVWDKEKKVKKSLAELENYPTLALYDVSMVKNLPVKISVATTLDALSHAFEAIWNKNRNPVSTQYAIQAIKLIYENIDGIGDDTSYETRRNLLIASAYAGLAFSNTRTAAAHSMSYPLTLKYNIPHGIACSITLKSLFELNKVHLKSEIKSILTALNISSMNHFWEKILKNIKMNIPYNLHEYGVPETDIPAIVSSSFQGDRIGNNIVTLNQDIIKEIISSIY